jgi:hypothetical protein
VAGGAAEHGDYLPRVGINCVYESACNQLDLCFLDHIPTGGKRHPSISGETCIPWFQKSPEEWHSLERMVAWRF